MTGIVKRVVLASGVALLGAWIALTPACTSCAGEIAGKAQVDLEDEALRNRKRMEQEKAERQAAEELGSMSPYDRGKALLKRRMYFGARESFSQCLEADPSNAECHLAIGSVYARLREPEKGVEHYREFLRLAPDHERASEVQKLMHDYEAQQSRQR